MSHHELSPDLQEIKERFIVNYMNGGLPAVEQMVEDLATEAQGASTFADVACDVEHDALMSLATLDRSEVVRTVDMANHLRRDSTIALSRHSFALFLLGEAKKQ